VKDGVGATNLLIMNMMGIDDTRYTCDICDGIGYILPKLNVIHDDGPEPED